MKTGRPELESSKIKNWIIEKRNRNQELRLLNPATGFAIDKEIKWNSKLIRQAEEMLIPKTKQLNKKD